ncbi:hypothetical protein ACFXD5_12080 [Streptomyces sp. NPDC059385]|uniref:hypothetical protein n=1 Tax=Streptomyces sp. NPDC059385 TaxID=3346817 RepID=UPI00368FBE60
MIRENRFLISHKGYAVDLATFSGTQKDRGDRISFGGSINAVWFRRSRGTLRACIGTLPLWSHYLPARLNLSDVTTVLSAELDGRYGGKCHGRWDGTRYWGSQIPELAASHIELLRPMLAAYPAIPPGYDGWWRFDNHA